MKYKILQIGINNTVKEISSFNNVEHVRLFLSAFLELRDIKDLLVEDTSSDTDIVSAKEFLQGVM